MQDSSVVIPFSQAPFSGKMPIKPKNKDVRSREYLTGIDLEDVVAGIRNGFEVIGK
tara:strand:- start:1476 stop:1643 length:168 start_codon:yes stop_codon:yes gene_type:complete